MQLRRKKINEKALKNWESGKGKPLWYSFNSLCHDLLDVILPRVTRLQIQKNGQDYVVPPQRDWLSTLESWHDFVYSPVKWGQFADYDSEINDYVFYANWEGLERFNSRYRDRFDSWSENNLWSLRKVLSRLGGVFEKTQLDSSEFALFLRAVEVIGDLPIGPFKKPFTLKSLNVTELR